MHKGWAEAVWGAGASAGERAYKMGGISTGVQGYLGDWCSLRFLRVFFHCMAFKCIVFYPASLHRWYQYYQQHFKQHACAPTLLISCAKLPRSDNEVGIKQLIMKFGSAQPPYMKPAIVPGIREWCA